MNSKNSLTEWFYLLFLGLIILIAFLEAHTSLVLNVIPQQSNSNIGVNDSGRRFQIKR